MKKQKHNPRNTIRCFAEALLGNAEPGTPWEHLAKGIELMLADPEWTKHDPDTLISAIVDDWDIAHSNCVEVATGRRKREFEDGKDGYFVRAFLALRESKIRNFDPPTRSVA